MTERLHNEAGYSLVEVLAAIVILTVAIIPMVSMFDMGLRSATTSGNYDRARALANMKLEEAKSLSYDTVKNTFPSGIITSSCGGGCTRSNYAPVTGATAGQFSGLEYSIEKQFMNRPSNAASQNFTARNTDDSMLKVVITVRWNGGNTYSATGLVSK